MALEASDLNDGQILQQTKQRTDPKGNIQFVIKLPSGRDLTSEWIQKDNVRAAMKTWLEVVKEQAVADSNAERLERAAKSRRASGKMDIERRPGDDQPLFRAGGARETPTYEANDTGTAEQQLEQMKPAKVEIVDAPRPDENAEADPLEFAYRQQHFYQQKVKALQSAEKRLRQWSIIVEQLEENE